MTKNEFTKIEAYMLEHMKDSAHDMHHIYRVLNSATHIACHESGVDMGVLITASLLHDIGREAQFVDPRLCHAQIGGEMAYDFLLSLEWPEEKALHAKNCINTHRYRGDNTPQSIEAKILFDADKLDACGALGIARTLIYRGSSNQALYILDEHNNIITDDSTDEWSFFQEYNFKLKNVYGTFYTQHANKLALDMQKTAINFYEGLHDEISRNYEGGTYAQFLN